MVGKMVLDQDKKTRSTKEGVKRRIIEAIRSYILTFGEPPQVVVLNAEEYQFYISSGGKTRFNSSKGHVVDIIPHTNTTIVPPKHYTFAGRYN